MFSTGQDTLTPPPHARICVGVCVGVLCPTVTLMVMKLKRSVCIPMVIWSSFLGLNKVLLHVFPWLKQGFFTSSLGLNKIYLHVFPWWKEGLFTCLPFL